MVCYYTWGHLLINSLQIAMLSLPMPDKGLDNNELNEAALAHGKVTYLRMYNVVFHQGNHLTTYTVQLSIHDCKPIQHIWPVQVEIAG